MATPSLDKTVQRAALLASLRTYPVPTIDVPTYALLCGFSLPRAYANVNEGKVEVWRDGRKVSVLVAPLLASLGYPLTPPSGFSEDGPNEAAIHSAYAPALGDRGIDYAIGL